MFFMFLCVATTCASLYSMEIETSQKITSNQECVLYHAKNGNFFKAFLHAKAIVPYLEKNRINSWSYFTLQAGMYAYLCNQRYFAKQYLQRVYEVSFPVESSLAYKRAKASYYLGQIALDEGNVILALKYLNESATINQTTSRNKKFFILIMNDLAELNKSEGNQEAAAQCYRTIVALREEFPYEAMAACIDLKRIIITSATQPAVSSFQSNGIAHGVLKI